MEGGARACGLGVRPTASLPWGTLLSSFQLLSTDPNCCAKLLRWGWQRCRRSPPARQRRVHTRGRTPLPHACRTPSPVPHLSLHEGDLVVGLDDDLARLAGGLGPRQRLDRHNLACGRRRAAARPWARGGDSERTSFSATDADIPCRTLPAMLLGPRCTIGCVTATAVSTWRSHPMSRISAASYYRRGVNPPMKGFLGPKVFMGKPMLSRLSAFFTSMRLSC